MEEKVLWQQFAQIHPLCLMPRAIASPNLDLGGPGEANRLVGAVCSFRARWKAGQGMLRPGRT